MASSANTHAILALMPAPALLVQRNGKCVAWNKRLSELLAPGDTTWEPASLRKLLPEESCRAIAVGTSPGTVRVRHVVNGSTPVSIDWSAQSWPDDDSLALVTGLDVTREVALEDYITDNQWFETAAALSGGLAHDFNNALAGILGLSEIISLRLPANSPLNDFAKKIPPTVERAKGVVRRFSQFSRKSTGTMDAQPVAMIMSDLVPLLKSFMPNIVTIETNFDPETPWCSAERHELEHLLLNCCTFFRGRMRKEGGLLRVACGPAEGKKGSRVSLTASGAGFTDVSIDRVCDLDLKHSETAYDSGAAIFTAKKIALNRNYGFTMQRDDERTLTFVVELPPAV